MPPRPKRSASSFMLWLNTKGRGYIKQQHPGYSITQVGRREEEIWRKMGENEKDKWKSQASLAMINYKRKMGIFISKYRRLHYQYSKSQFNVQ
ncbi:mobility group protein 1B-like [Drosophila madeirensis]|uniref:Mobility group protein 1B-like n=1 Tax=Drosophila madeirensis TaxID=30013 RepID=A0AAU9F9T8_DROMD